MKKKTILFILLVILVSLIGSTVAEEYTFHSGITFGMTKDEVIDAEKANNFTYQEEVYPFAYYDDNGTYMGENVKIPVIKGSIAGIQDSEIYYYFDKSDKLIEIVYAFKGCTVYDMNEDILNQYDTIENQLKKNYASVWKDCTENFPSSVDAIDNGRITYKQTSHKIELNDYETIYIKHSLTYAKLSGSNLSATELLLGTGSHYLSYRLEKNNDIKAIEEAKKEQEERERKQKEDAEKEKQEQLNSDL